METAQVNADKKPSSNSKVIYTVNRLDTHIYVHTWVCECVFYLQ